MINEQTIRKACNELADMLVKKNHDYGDSVYRQFKKHGETSLLIRLEDKLNRLEQLKNAPAQVEEKKAETWIDAAGYSVLAYILTQSDVRQPEPLQTLSDGLVRARKSPFEEQYAKYFDPDDQH